MIDVVKSNFRYVVEEIARIKKILQDNKKERRFCGESYYRNKLRDLRDFKNLLFKEEKFYEKNRLFPRERVGYLMDAFSRETVYFAELKKRTIHHHKEIIKLETLRLDSFQNMKCLFDGLKKDKKRAFEANGRFKEQFKLIDNIFEEVGDIKSSYLMDKDA